LDDRKGIRPEEKHPAAVLKDSALATSSLAWIYSGEVIQLNKTETTDSVFE